MIVELLMSSAIFISDDLVIFCCCCCCFLDVIFVDVDCESNIESGWQNLSAFRRGQKWSRKFSSSAYLQFSRQMHRFSNLTQYNMQYIPCNSALLAQGPRCTVFTQKGTFYAQRSQKKVRKSRQIIIRDKIAYVRA